MAIDGLAIKRPAVTVVEIDDPTLAGAGVDLLDLDAVQLQSMPLRVRRVIVRLEACTVVNYSTNAPVRTRTSVLEGLIAFVTFGPRAQGTVNGLTVFPGLMLAIEPATEGRFVVEAGYESIAFLVRAADIKMHLVARGREADFQPPRGVEALQVDAERVRVLYDWGRRLVDVAARAPHTFDEGRQERTVAQVDLLEALLAATQASSTVSAEALKWGFWHFGEFSRAYKQCFGELPSDTLRRAPGEEGPASEAHGQAERPS
jgi:AraC-like DNA-binding protein